MIFRWNRCVRRKYWILAVIFLGCALSVATFLSSAPNLLPSTSLHHRRYPERKSMVVVATRAGKNGDDNKSSLDSESSSTSSSSSDGIFGFFSGGSNRNKDAKGDEKNQQDENNNDNDGDDDENDNDNDSTGLFRSIAKKLENRKEARKVRVVLSCLASSCLVSRRLVLSRVVLPFLFFSFLASPRLVLSRWRTHSVVRLTTGSQIVVITTVLQLFRTDIYTARVSIKPGISSTQQPDLKE